MIDHPVGLSFQANLPIIKKMAQAIQRRKYKDLILVCSGSSGAIIATAISLSLKTKVPIFYVHKADEDHHYHMWGDEVFNSSIVVVDDFICSGKTIHYIERRLKEKGVKRVDALCITGPYPKNIVDKEFYKSIIHIRT